VKKPTDDGLFERARLAMVQKQIAQRGVKEASVLAALRAVPRHRFVDPRDSELAYADHPLPIGHGQTISQPYMVARMVELCRLDGHERVLEVGAGSGYQAAVLAQLCRHVYAVEIVAELADRARVVLEELAIDNVTLAERDGSEGWPEHAPFDAIVVAAGAPEVPRPLLDQLEDGGRLVIPVGPTRGLQSLQLLERSGDEIKCWDDLACRFVDLQGRYGW
jgi:protein-L-isoaspartate(D-aspartate) O-methyltransferase